MWGKPILWIVVMISVLAGGNPVSAQSIGFAHSRVEVVTLAGKRHTFAVELASTPEQLSQGLMFRKTLAADAGMLFDFGPPKSVAMWMKNTLIPLDMLFMDREGRIIHVEEYAVPGTLLPRGPSEPVRAVLEVAAGTSRRLGLRAGDTVEHPLFAAGR
ncbi:conserved hypothetical protein [Candidatus Terasakiella magnetica]|nr:conserved hypothetical protein [Candidatus Terasakiella magnetica]